MIKNLKDLKEYCKQNQLFIAFYKRNDDNKQYVLIDEVKIQHKLDDNLMITAFYDDDEKPDYVREAVSNNKEHFFRLHNNYNVPDVIPTF